MSNFSQEEIDDAEAQILEQSKRIEFYLTEYSIELLVQKLTSGDFFVPEYQRKFTWEESRKCRFIESILMGLPIPFLFFWEDPDTGKLEIVDGSQRLRTLEQFLGNDLALSSLDKLEGLNGFKFGDLPESRQRKIKNRSIRGIILNEHADEQARFDLFDRINTGSKVANTAEVRRGAMSGPFMDMVIELAVDGTLVKLSPLSDKDENERVREELVTRFFAFGDGLGEGLTGYKDNVGVYVSGYADKMNQIFEDAPERRSEYEQVFHQTMQFIELNFPWGFRRTEKGKTTPRSSISIIAKLKVH